MLSEYALISFNHGHFMDVFLKLSYLHEKSKELFSSNRFEGCKTYLIEFIRVCNEEKVRIGMEFPLYAECNLALVYAKLSAAQSYLMQPMIDVLSSIDLAIETLDYIIRERSHELFPGSELFYDTHLNLAVFCYDRATILQAMDMKSAISSYRKASVTLNSLIKKTPTYPPISLVDFLARTYIQTGKLYFKMGDLNSALVVYQSALSTYKSLGDEILRPCVKGVIEVFGCLAMLYDELGDTLNAQSSYRFSVEICNHLNELIEPIDDYETDLLTAMTFANYGKFQNRLGLLSGAVSSMKASVNIYENIPFERAQGDITHKIHLSRCYINLATTLMLLEEPVEALSFCFKSMPLINTLQMEMNPENINTNNELLSDLSRAHDIVATIYFGKNIFKVSYFYHKESIRLYRGIFKNKKTDLAQFAVGFSSVLLNFSRNLIKHGKVKESVIYLNNLIQLGEDFRDKHIFELQNSVAIGYLMLGGVQYKQKDIYNASHSLVTAILWCDDLRLKMGDYWLWQYQETYFSAIGDYIAQSGSLPNEVCLHPLLDIIARNLELFPSKGGKSKSLLTVLLHFFLKQSDFNFSLQVLSVLQGRELYHSLQKAHHASSEHPELDAYFNTRECFRQAIEQYALIKNEALQHKKKSEIEGLRQAFFQARSALAELPSFKFILMPFELSIADLQQDLTLGFARFIWLDLPSEVSAPSIQGVLAIPSSGMDIIWIDLTGSDIKPALTLLSHLFVAQDINSRFISSAPVDNVEMASYCQLHQQALELSDDDIQVLTSLNEDNHEYGVELSNDRVNKLIAKTWSQIKMMQSKIWQSSALTDWLARHEIRKIYHLSHGLSHNKPLTVGSTPHLEHNVLPNLSLFRLRQHMADSSFTEHQSDGFAQIISCPGEWEADQHIPFTALEAEVVAISLPEQTNTRVVSPTREITPHENQFPKHNNPLSFLHISCHGEQQTDGLTKLLLSTAESSVEIKIHDLWQIAPENSIGFSMINACIGGIVLDNQEGDPQGLVVPLLARSRNVISSLLPVNDIIATVFSALFYHFIQSNQTIEQAFLKTKQHITDGNIPESVLEKVIHVMQPIFQQEHLGWLILRLQQGVLEPTNDTYLLHCLAAIVPNIQEAEKISAKNGITIAEYLENEFRSRMKLTHIPPMMREIAMAGYQLYG
jgi:tetratricopeptide (TPR) repeat protein